MIATTKAPFIFSFATGVFLASATFMVINSSKDMKDADKSIVIQELSQRLNEAVSANTVLVEKLTAHQKELISILSSSSSSPSPSSSSPPSVSSHSGILFPRVWGCPSDAVVIPGSYQFYSQNGEDEQLWQIYFQSPLRTSGVFVELGALDGTTYSNTRFFEESLDWRGVLIEASPANSQKLFQNRAQRSANFAMAVCDESVHSITFAGGGGAVSGVENVLSNDLWNRIGGKDGAPRVEVLCIPISHVLNAVGVTHIDLFSLDVEGAEYMVLQTMDWNIQVHVFLIELDNSNPGKDQNVRDLLAAKGFESRPRIGPNDVFVNPRYDANQAKTLNRQKQNNFGVPCK